MIYKLVESTYITYYSHCPIIWKYEGQKKIIGADYKKINFLNINLEERNVILNRYIEQTRMSVEDKQCDHYVEIG